MARLRILNSTCSFVLLIVKAKTLAANAPSTQPSLLPPMQPSTDSGAVENEKEEKEGSSRGKKRLRIESLMSLTIKPGSHELTVYSSWCNMVELGSLEKDVAEVRDNFLS